MCDHFIGDLMHHKQLNESHFALKFCGFYHILGARMTSNCTTKQQ